MKSYYEVEEKISMKQIDLFELLQYLFRKWWLFLIVAFAFAGAFYLIESNSVQSAQMKQSIVLSEEEQLAVDIVSDTIEQLRLIDQYVDESLLMQIDPMNESLNTMVFYVDVQNDEEIENLIRLYTNYIQSGEFISDEDPNKKYITELVTVSDELWDNENLGYNILSKNNILCIDVKGKSRDQVDEISKIIKEDLPRYKDELSNSVEKHEITLVEEMYIQRADYSLLIAQKNVNKQAVESNDIIIAQKAKLSSSQLAAVEEQTGVVQETRTVSITMLLIGAVLGCALLFVVLCIVYILDDKIHNSEGAQRVFKLPVYMNISKENETDANSMKELADNIVNRLSTICNSKDIDKIFLWNDQSISLESVSKDDIEKVEVGYDIINSDVDLNKALACKNVVVLIMKDITTYSELKERLDFCKKYNLKVIGFIMIENI